jgi:hypothetical protein
MKLFAKTFGMVATFEEEYLANIAQVRLLAAGIRAEVSATSTFRWNPFSPQSDGRFSLLVPSGALKKARAILKSQSRRGRR